MTLRAYLGFNGRWGSHEGAIAIFANDSREAKRIGFLAFEHLYGDCEYIDFRVRWIRDGMDQHADYELLETGQPHVNDSPGACDRCELWYADVEVIDGLCEYCREDDSP